MTVRPIWMVLILALTYAGVVWVIPAASRLITGSPFPLPVPSSLVLMYMGTAVFGVVVYASISDTGLRRALSPLARMLRGEFGSAAMVATMVVPPLLAGSMVFSLSAPDAALPVTLRAQHPSSAFPEDYAKKVNPHTKPSDAAVNAFIEAARDGDVALIAPLATDVEAWVDEMEPDHPLQAFASPQIDAFLAQLDGATVDINVARAALVEVSKAEGRAIYAMSCAPCHGASGGGNGHLARGFTLRPINFTQSGTIDTIVEGYALWRVAKGGAALPVEATPWNSSMPAWGETLSEDEMWKVLLALYDLAQSAPRPLEAHQ